MLQTDTACRVVRFVVRQEPFWQFEDRIVIVDAADHPDLVMPGDTAVVPCDDGLLIYAAIEEFDEFPIALANFGEMWFRTAEQALKGYVRRQTPRSVLS